MITALDPKAALILIDLQNGIASLPLFKPAKDVIEKSSIMVKAFHERGLPVIFINVNPFKDTHKILRATERGLPATKEAIEQTLATMRANRFFDIVPELALQEHDLRITKGNWNAFFNTDLHEKLQETGTTQIVLAGIATSIGVEGTARAANELGYNIAFAKDAMSDFTETAHQHSLNVIFPRIGEVDDAHIIVEKLKAV